MPPAKHCKKRQLKQQDQPEHHYSLTDLSDALLHTISLHLDYPSILNLSSTNHRFHNLFFSLSDSISPFRPIHTKDYIPRRLCRPASLTSLPNELTLHIMKFCTFKSLRALFSTNRHFLSLPPLELFQTKLLELEKASLNPLPHRPLTQLNNLSSLKKQCQQQIVYSYPCYSCLQAFDRSSFPFVFWNEKYGFGAEKASDRTCRRCCVSGFDAREKQSRAIGELWVQIPMEGFTWW